MATQVLREAQPAADAPRDAGGLGTSEGKTTGEVIALARKFVEDNYLGVEGFRGAHLVGSINHTDHSRTFPTYRDVDIAIVLDRVDYQEIEEVFHEGYVLECILSGTKRYASAEEILALPGMACNLEVDSVLVDPDGHLTQIHRKVSADFAKRVWVRKRVDAGLESARGALTAVQQASSPIEAVHALGELIMHCSEILTVAHLNPPTHRRSLADLRPLMETEEELRLYEELLAAFGSSQITEPEARRFLEQCLAAFDRALEVKRRPVPFEWKLDPCIRDYLEKGTLEMIEEGNHRESLFWITLFFVISTVAIQQDGTPEDKQAFGTRMVEFLEALGVGSEAAIAQRIQDCGGLIARIQDYADRFVATSPKLKD